MALADKFCLRIHFIFWRQFIIVLSRQKPMASNGIAAVETSITWSKKSQAGQWLREGGPPQAGWLAARKAESLYSYNC